MYFISSLGILFSIVLLVGHQGQAQEGTIQFSFRDYYTGYAVPATIIAYQGDQKIQTLTSNQKKQLIFSDTPGHYQFKIKAAGYQPLRTHFSVHQQDTLFVKAQLTPSKRPPCVNNLYRKSRIAKKQNKTFVTGFVVNQQTGQPISNACISIKNRAGNTFSDANGYFFISLPAANKNKPSQPPGTFSLIIDKTGYNSRIIKNNYRIRDAYLLKINLSPGNDKTKDIQVHGLYQNKQVSPSSKLNNITPSEPKIKDQTTPMERGTGRATVLTPPNSIRVGLSCSCTSCSNVNVMSLEAYVGSGLNDEWISSWHKHSLRAGAISYRSYGAWYTQNPINANYDICTSTCCQVWDSDITASTDTAAKYTSGILIEDGGSIARSEYSAENNNNGCGDCYSGTSTTWPCIQDTVGCGYADNGHGRGMCQWCSQRWSNDIGQTWKWIGQHYYNPGNMYFGTPVEITNVTPNPAIVQPGDLFTINLNAENYAAYNHPQIMIGATISSVGSDPTHDKKSTVYTGSNNLYRLFQVPQTAAPGTYDLLVALWFDVNEDNNITGADLPLHLVTVNNAVTITADSIPPGTNINAPLDWQTSDFQATFSDTDNVGGTGIEKSFYQVIDFDGKYWRANTNNGFFSDNFDSIIHNNWTNWSGSWSISNNALFQANESNSNTNIFAPLEQSLSNAYLYHWQMYVTGSGNNRRAGVHIFSDNPQQTNRGNSYLVWFRVDDNRLQLYEVDNNTLNLVVNEPVSINSNQWLDCKVIYNRIKGYLDVYLNGERLVSWTDDSPLATGSSISFRTGNCQVYFNNLKVYRSRYPTETIKVGPDSTNDVRYQNPDSSTSACKVKSIARDSAGNISLINQKWVNIDWTPPLPIQWVRDGASNDIDTTTKNNELSANWASTVDSHSNIKAYMYAIGTVPSDSNIVNWTTNNFQVGVTHAGLSLIEDTTYYFSVRAVNNAGLVTTTAVSDGQIYTVETGLKETSTSSVQIFPNPADKHLIILYHAPERGTLSIKLYNLSGQRIISKTYPVKPNNRNKIIFPLNGSSEHLASGTYLISIKQGNNIVKRKIIIK